MTEEDFQAAGGNREHTGRASPIAQRWADNMTKHYDELAVAEPVFGELENCMDLAIVAALIVRENLPQKADCTLPTLLEGASIKPAELQAPTQVDSRVSMLRGRNWVIQRPPAGIDDLQCRDRRTCAIQCSDRRARNKLAPAEAAGTGIQLISRFTPAGRNLCGDPLVFSDFAHNSPARQAGPQILPLRAADRPQLGHRFHSNDPSVEPDHAKRRTKYHAADALQRVL